MAATAMNLNAPRHILSDAIVEEIRSWAELPRRVFTLSHYAGKSVEEIARQSGCGIREVSHILDIYERKLLDSLRTFRGL
jgi:hypothetical protein